MTVCLYVAIINWQLEPPVTTSAGAAGLEGIMEPSSFQHVSTVVSVISQDPENQRVLLDGETFGPFVTSRQEKRAEVRSALTAASTLRQK